ncbi:MAG: hypothetical protein QM760_20185 [Nibricoccus sp.]
MKTLLVVAVVLALGVLAKAETLAERAANLIASADSAGIRGEMDKKEKELVVRDSKWIHEFSEAIAKSEISKSVACMCAGWRTVTFYKDGEFVVSVAAIHGNQLRIYSKNDGGDFPIDEAQWKVVKALLDAKKEANQTSEPTAPSGRGSP